MAGKRTKQSVFVLDAPTDLAAVAKLIEELRASLTNEYRTSFTSLETKLDGLQISVADQGQRLTSLEDGLNRYSDKLEEMEARCLALEDGNAKLKARMVQIESRSRRSNVRIVGLDESIGPGDGVLSTDFFAEVLVEILGTAVLPDPPELDRCHRALTAKRPPGSKPRAVIACLHRYRTKEAIIREARKKRGSLSYKGKPVLIFEDYCPEVVELRSGYREVMGALYKQGFKPSLLYPARLVIKTKDGKRKELSSPKDAAVFLKAQSRAGSPSQSPPRGDGAASASPPPPGED